MFGGNLADAARAAASKSPFSKRDNAGKRILPNRQGMARSLNNFIKLERRAPAGPAEFAQARKRKGLLGFFACGSA